MRVAWLQDKSASVGGAELTCREFLASAPVEVVQIGPDQLDVASGCDRAVLHNVVSFPPETVERLGQIPIWKYHHDLGEWVHPQLQQDLHERAIPIFCSKLQARTMGYPDGICIPPAVDLEPFRAAAANAGERRGAVTVGAWMNWGKSPERAREVAPDVAFFGFGPCSPAGTQAVDYEAMPELLARYRTFIHLPSVLEPFGRTVVEAWATGCKVVVNNLVGAREWIETAPDKLDAAAADFWQVVLGE